MLHAECRMVLPLRLLFSFYYDCFVFFAFLCFFLLMACNMLLALKFFGD